MNVKISIPDLRKVSIDRPTGYYDDVISNGSVNGDVLTMDQEVYAKLRKRYSPVTLGKKSSSLAGAAFRAAKAAMKGETVKASQTEIDRRLSICQDCEFFQESPMKCLKCGCYLNLKARLETEHCPINKW